MARKKETEGIYDRGTVPGKPRYWGRIRWPGMNNPRREFLSTDHSVAVMKFAKWKQEKDELLRYGDTGWAYAVEEYFKHSNNTERSKQGTRYAIALYESVVHPRQLADLNPQNMLRAIPQILNGEKKYSLNTIDQRIKQLMAISHWGADMGLCPLYNWRVVKPLSKTRRRKGIFSEDQLAEIFKAVSGMWYTLCMLLLEAGLRRAEAYWLRWEDLALDENYGKIEAHDGWTPKMESDDRLRYFVITPALKEHLLEKKKAATSKYVFAEDNGHRPNFETSIGDYFAKLSTTLGFHIFAHKFRHTFVTRLLERGEGKVSVRNAARHRNMSTTEGYDDTDIKTSLQAVKASVFEHKNEHTAK